MSYILKSLDPRAVRTRHLIFEAMILLLEKKDFNNISVSEITQQATINRATFYAHFKDKYALLDSLLVDSFMEFIHRQVNIQDPLDKKSIVNLMIALCEYHIASSKRCVKHYDSIASLVEKNVRSQLEQFIQSWLHLSFENRCLVSTAALILSHSIYGLTYRWNLSESGKTPAEMAEESYPFVQNIIATLSEK